MISTDSPLQILIAIVTFIVAIGVLVAVHEFGHFWVARRLGIRVLRFSIGIGKPLYRRVLSPERDPVEFVVAGIPLGGYVKLLDEREGNVAPHEVARAFNRAPIWRRIAVLLAGPAFNFLFAILLYFLLFTAGVEAPKAIVGEVKPDTIAAQAGLRNEDEILEIGGSRAETWDAALLAILDDLTDDGTINMRVRGVDGGERELALIAGDRSRSLTQPEALFPGLGFDIWRPRLAAVVGEVLADSAAARAGLKVDDEILKLDGKPIADFGALVKLVEPSMGRMVTLEVRRGGELMQLPITIGEGTAGNRRVGLMGIRPANKPLGGGRSIEDIYTVQQYGPVAALTNATAKTWDTSIFTVRIIGRIVTGGVSLKAISGPISIAETTGVAVRHGWRVFLSTLALISISLGVINLMPIPILDGGQVVYQLAELVKGKPVSERAQLLGQQIGIAVLIMMMTLAFYNDIARHLS